MGTIKHDIGSNCRKIRKHYFMRQDKKKMIILRFPCIYTLAIVLLILNARYGTIVKCDDDVVKAGGLNQPKPTDATSSPTPSTFSSTSSATLSTPSTTQSSTKLTSSISGDVNVKTENNNGF